MGKFDGILLCTDLDDTLLTEDKRVSDENIRAIEYFMSEGGLFTFATGRVPHGARLMLDFIRPNAPMVCFNGAAIFDFSENKMLFSEPVGADAVKVCEYIDNALPYAGIEVCTEKNVYFCKTNARVEEHKRVERFPDNERDYHDINEKWIKVIFITENENMGELRAAIAMSPYAEKYSFVQSSPWYYELLPKGANKGQGLTRLADMLGIDRSRTIALGDNENDLELIRLAGTGIAVSNAIDEIKDAADLITVSNAEHAAAAVIGALDSGEIKV